MNFKLDDSLGFILSKVNTKLKNEFFQQLREYDVTPEQWAILCCLWEQEGITPKEIADLTGVSINTALGRMRYALLNLRKIIEKNQIILTN